MPGRYYSRDPHPARAPAPRPAIAQRIIAALATAQGPMPLDAIRQVAGLTQLQALTALDQLMSAGKIKAMGDMRYSIN